MPAPLDVNREAVRTLALDIGVREAARQMGLNENTVIAWSKRDGWFDKPKLPPTMIQPAIGAIKPSQAMANTLAEQGDKTRHNLSKVALRASKQLDELPGEALLDKDLAQTAKAWTGVTSAVHSWQDKSNAGANIMVNVALISG